MPKKRKRNREDLKPGLLKGARVYLSGPMDFVASRENEMKFGWRNRVSSFLKRLGVTVFDPWNKPEVRGLLEFDAAEDVTNTDVRERWTFRKGKLGARDRADCAERFWPALHIDLRMVDTCDFVIAYCPTNIYSVGTVHEIVLARQQRKPVLFVSPTVSFPALDSLRRHLVRQADEEGKQLLAELEKQVPIKANPRGAPSLWYMPLIGGEHFFDGFGFSEYHYAFSAWKKKRTELDDREARRSPRKPLLAFIEGLNRELPKKWSRAKQAFVENDDWLLGLGE